MSAQAVPRQFEPKRKFAERYGVTVRTVDRWVDDGVIDPPKRIKNREYFPIGTEPRFDAERKTTP
jgi:predicted site-specific integrase-resolvase